MHLKIYEMTQGTIILKEEIAGKQSFLFSQYLLN